MTHALDISGLRKTYRGGHEALQGIDLHVAQGDFFALLGPNGAGKSTTIGIVTALVKKSAGSVQVFGHDIDREPMMARRCIGLVPQEFNFNQFEPVIEIVVNQAGYYGVPKAQALQRAETYLKQLGLWNKRRELARNLSGGMKRRLMIARALAHEPKLLILDEPTAGVDIELRRSMWKFLREVNARGTTIILTTHYLEEAENLCRNVAIIDAGRIVANTSIRTLLHQLNSETVVLDLKEPLAHTPHLDGYGSCLADACTLEVDIPRAEGINRLFQLLSAQGIEVVSLRNKTNRLEELFLRLVENGGSQP
ncbi:ABC transporter ATP-binding protein [Sulfurivermis fontis]|uniref:ABC transporter ATP-binding protein n=1 Tax=Sulfurivermis fontis TaxID=1972068 RepID=UPI000FDC13EA|nr:ABC transporter ATP-binding protein [Sulfurivermis fontis]